MNQVIQTILKRRSIRKYHSKPVKKSDIETILQAGIFAPTGADAEPWHLTAITNLAYLEELNQKAKTAMSQSGIERIIKMGENPNYHIFFNAPVVILISGEKVLRKTGTHLSALADCSAAIQNMQLAAASLGIGTCWVGLIRYLFEKDQSMSPEGYTPLYALTLGYSAGPEAIRPRKRREGTILWIE